MSSGTKKKNKPLKIIHLHQVNFNKPHNYSSEESDFYYVASWAGLIARKLAQQYPEKDIEVWKTEKAVPELKTANVFGLQARVFPYKYPVIKQTLTFAMLREIYKLSRQYTLIIHYHSVFDQFTFLGPWILRNTKIFLTHHGVAPLHVNKKWKFRFKRLLARISYPRIHCITFLNERMKNLLQSLPHHPPLQFLTVGADFQIFKPEKKEEARKKLGLDADKTYAIYVGRLYRLKGVDKILDVQEQLKKRYNFEVIFVGADSPKEPEIHKRVLNSGNPYFGVQKYTDMNTFYNAADFYIHPVFNEDVGFDASLMESMACGRPVVSTRLEIADFDTIELGLSVNSEKDIIEKTKYMIHNFSNYNHVRETAFNYFDSNTAIPDRIMKMYYKDDKN